MEPINLTEDEWRQKLTPEQYYILRQKGTERPYTGALLDNQKHGLYTCAGCGNDLFISDTKFDSGCGWPSFFAPIGKQSIKLQIDRSHGMIRSEVLCGQCGGHLGHVFPDGPPPTGDRYCMNSGALKFTEKD